jgi:hypothetical protein
VSSGQVFFAFFPVAGCRFSRVISFLLYRLPMAFLNIFLLMPKKIGDYFRPAFIDDRDKPALVL